MGAGFRQLFQILGAPRNGPRAYPLLLSLTVVASSGALTVHVHIKHVAEKQAGGGLNHTALLIMTSYGIDRVARLSLVIVDATTKTTSTRSTSVRQFYHFCAISAIYSTVCNPPYQENVAHHM